MLYSNERKLALSGWLRQNGKKEYETPLKFQKFLFLYEAFSKVSGEKPDFGHLRGYKRGPVFSDVWGVYTKERDAFNKAVDESYESGQYHINEERARKCAFIVRILSENELSELTHVMNLWRAKEERIMDGEHQVDLEEKDFDDEDARLIKKLDEMYPIRLIDNSEVFDIGKYCFVFQKEDVDKLTEAHFDILCTLAENEQLFNPVYVEIDEGGRLIID